MTRIERVTSPLPRECSTTEPHGPKSGAGEGNRTLVVSLEGFCSTIELHPPAASPARRPHSRRSTRPHSNPCTPHRRHCTHCVELAQPTPTCWPPWMQQRQPAISTCF